MPGVERRDARTSFWIETMSPALEGRLATQYALANGYLGLRGAHEEMPSWGSPGFFMAGTYCTAPQTLIPIHSPDHILTHPERVKPEHHGEYTTMTTMPNLPNPVAVRLTVGGFPVNIEDVSVLACERWMHMEEARLTRRLVFRDAAGKRVVVDSERFVSWNNPHLVCFRYQVMTEDNEPAFVEPYINTDVTNVRKLQLFTVVDAQHEPGFNQVTVDIVQSPQRVTIAQAYTVRHVGNLLTLDVVVAVSDKEHSTVRTVAQAALAEGYDHLLEEHRQAVREAYTRSLVQFDGDALSVQGFNFGRMHMEMALCRDNPHVTVPIKGLTGEGYRFVIFWDTDFHLFPYYLLTNPAQARNHILYRHHLLDAARRNAQSWGYRGAQVPWETGATGEEETAPWLNLQERELHISADAAYCVKLYNEWANDPELLVTHGAELVFETARFFASRVTRNHSTGQYEINNIGCPDQYHTYADNNAFINRMAKWNLAYAAELAGDPRLQAVRAAIGLTEDEVADFAEKAEKMYVIAPNADGIIEEFDGFFMRSTDLRGISELFCEHTQAVKQPDVLLLFQPFGDEYAQEVQQKNWHFYEARTLHGSSLSLPGMALAGAKCGLLDQALDYFQRAARMDLDDLNLNTNLGVHLAGYAVLWETAVFGFGGLAPQRDRLVLTPRLPRQWSTLTYAIFWHGNRVVITMTPDAVCVAADAANGQDVPVQVHDGVVQPVAPGEELTMALADTRLSPA